ncbi:MAG: hypothetical protein HUU15_19710, partial [Candidatus Brocadiae bacterium]|nr:hypothetical protein [Candidatus Brocadiia bacterium]
MTRADLPVRLRTFRHRLRIGMLLALPVIAAALWVSRPGSSRPAAPPAGDASPT